MTEPVFRIAGLRKSFGSTQVLGGVDLVLESGKVTVLMGANGAGKSTLVKIISGVYPKDSGTMTLDGQDFAPQTPAAAMRSGIVTVHQSINDGVVADLDVATNLLLDRLTEKGARIFFNPRRIRQEASEVARRMGINLDLKAMAKDLPLADRQMLAIARAMAHQPKVLILDEPTSSLSKAEADRLFLLLDRLRDSGVAILYISHRMSDIRRMADTIIALRDGKIAGQFTGPTLDYEGAVNAMLGEKVSLTNVVVQDATKDLFSADNLVIEKSARPFSFHLRDGEVVVVTGLVGVGKTRLAETLFGLVPPLEGSMKLDGKVYRPSSTRDAIDQGVFLVAKDRAHNGIVPDFNLYENISVPFLRSLARFGLANRTRERAIARDHISTLKIVCRSERDALNTLSGGNQQKVMVARWLSNPARVLILDEPFQGVDIAARRDIGAKLRASAAGRATLVFLTELDEAFEIADRIIVMSEHSFVGEHRNSEINMDRLLAEIVENQGSHSAQ